MRLGRRYAPGRRQGFPDPAWIAHVAELMQQGRVDRLIIEATTERMQRAGNVAGELLTWIAALGVIGERQPEEMLFNRQDGEVYGIWR
jgi:protocatechuate 4,5-dioxygenase beta chain